jgi:hypothetical protein
MNNGTRSLGSSELEKAFDMADYVQLSCEQEEQHDLKLFVELHTFLLRFYPVLLEIFSARETNGVLPVLPSYVSAGTVQFDVTLYCSTPVLSTR